MDEYKQVKELLYKLDVASNYNEYTKIKKQLQKIQDSNDELLKDIKNKNYVPYPEITDVDFYKKLLRKKEFIENSYQDIKVDNIEEFGNISNDKCNTNAFELSMNQMFIRNFMSYSTPYNSVLLYHGVGVGKTCTSINVVEQFLDNTNDKRKVFILMPSTLLKDNYKKQIYDSGKKDDLQCVASKYTSMISSRAMLNEVSLERKINKLISTRYKFLGLIEFVNEIKRMGKELNVPESEFDTSIKLHRQLENEYNDSIFVIDEVHNIRLNSDLTNKRVPPILQLVLKHARNIKLILMTATPMFNDPKEIIYILNLMLYNDKRQPLKIDDIFHKNGILKNEEKLMSTMKGYISYMKGNNPFTFPFRLYPSVNGDKNVLKFDEVPKTDINGNPISKLLNLKDIELIKSNLHDIQYRLYRQSDTISNDDDDENNFNLQLCIQVSNIVYPVNTGSFTDCYGENGFWGCFKKVKGKHFSVKYRDEYVDILHYNNIENYSCKIKTILDYIKKSTGIVFIYSNWKWSGVLPLAIALEHEGYGRYNKNNILQNGTKKKNNHKYIILSGDTQLSPDNDREIWVAKNDKNKHGDNIKVILATSVATEGIDLKCIREVHILEPWFHMNKLEQIIGRAVRTCSHIQLNGKHRNVTIYHHVAAISNEERESIDLRLYRISMEKQNKIKKVESIMKNVAIDCVLNKPLNTLSNENIDVDFPIETSQGHKIVYNVPKTEKIKCIVNKPSRVDNSTFKMSFYDNLVSKYEKYVKHYFETNLYGTFDDIYAFLSSNTNTNSEVLILSLHNLVTMRTTFMDINMNYGYLIYISDKYIFNKIGTNIYMSLNSRERGYSNLQDLELQYDVKKSIDVLDVIELIESAVKSVCDDMKINDVKFSNISNYIYDFVIDRLSKNDFLKICNYIWENNKTSATAIEFINSLNRSNLIVYDKDKNILAVICPHDEKITYYVRENGDLREITDLELKENKHIIESTKPIIDRKLEDYSAYLITKFDGTNRFKILQKDKESLGFVCDQTSTLKVQNLKLIIDEMDNTFLSEFKKLPQKKKLCEFYELLLRIKNQFARPYIFVLLTSSKKMK